MVNILVLAIGFILLVKGADYFVNGASEVSKKLKVPSLIIGLTIVAFGTSAPEASVSIAAAISKNNDLSIGNIVGSNIFNLLIVLGVSLLFSKIHLKKEMIRRDFSFIILSSVLLLLFSLKVNNNLILSLVEGIILLVIFIGYVILNIKSSKDNKTEIPSTNTKLIFNLLFLIGGLLAIIFGGRLVTNSAVELAKMIGITENLIGLTIVGIGTSLPELITSIVANKKGEKDIAIGNVIGSNIFNILFILGASAVISPLTVNVISLYDMVILLVISIVFVIYSSIKKELGKKEGIIMILTYIAYMIYIILRDIM